MKRMTDVFADDNLARSREERVQRLRRQEEERLAQHIATQNNLPYVDLLLTPIDGAALTLISRDVAHSVGAIIFSKKDRAVTMAAKDPSSGDVATLVKKLSDDGWHVSLAVTSTSSIEHGLSLFEKFAYLSTKITGEVALATNLIEQFRASIKDIASLRAAIEKTAPSDISGLLELIVGGAMTASASDIHIEPQEEQARIRLRIDGVLYDLLSIKPKTYHFILERIKLLSGLKLNISDKGQDGRFSFRIGSEEIEIRTSTLPGERGEYIVMRVLNPSKIVSAHDLGLRPDLFTVLEKELKRPNGMILTSGPTGSGKTTALAAFVQHIASPEIKVITIEDPIEYKLEGVEQTQVNAEEGYDFANGLRSIVRQDPDVILVGEIRDLETAQIGMQAALTGHLVFSTLHSNDAAGVIPRLVELGVKPDTIGPALNIAMAQRLVRKLCPSCVTKERISPQDLTRLQKSLERVPANLFPQELTVSLSLPVARGCQECNNTGYRGRTGIFEFLRIDGGLEELILSNPSNHAILKWSVENGMIPMQQDGILKILAGLTTVEEIERITGPIG